ncbi:hypothetical protein AcV5_001949 [Taiwanofungus camphoratus]|nr:hypothetical protein AcV5_001949 [Antrodia cinnamomea]KAI0960706.1 hypothetical protein AcV7_000011 [Antrodia cinnamomea]
MLMSDRDVFHELVNFETSLAMVNKEGKTAESLAQRYGMEQDLRPQNSGRLFRKDTNNLVMALLMFLITFVDASNIQDAVKENLGKLYAITDMKEEVTKLCKAEITETNRLAGCVPGCVVQHITTPLPAEEFKTSLDSYVTDSGLDKFFASDDALLQTIAQKASALRDDPTTLLGKPENIKRLTRLSVYQLVVYCDDSSSMRDHNRYEHQRKLVSRIARIATKVVPDEFGVELRFINAKPEYEGNMPAAKIEAAIAAVRPNGGTQIGTVLRNKILQPLVYDVLASGHQLKRPLLVCAITDGDPSQEETDTFKKEIVACRRTLAASEYGPTAVMFNISQIGNDKNAKAFLDGLRGDTEIRDVLYCTTDQLDSKFQELKENENKLEEWLLKTLTNPIMARDGI